MAAFAAACGMRSVSRLDSCTGPLWTRARIQSASQIHVAHARKCCQTNCRMCAEARRWPVWHGECLLLSLQRCRCISSDVGHRIYRPHSAHSRRHLDIDALSSWPEHAHRSSRRLLQARQHVLVLITQRNLPLADRTFPIRRAWLRRRQRRRWCRCGRRPAAPRGQQ